jgi:hypothetical protein
MIQQFKTLSLQRRSMLRQRIFNTEVYEVKKNTITIAISFIGAEA